MCNDNRVTELFRFGLVRGLGGGREVVLSMGSIGCVGESIRVVEANRRNEAIRRNEDDEFKMEEGAPRFGFCLE